MSCGICFEQYEFASIYESVSIRDSVAHRLREPKKKICLKLKCNHVMCAACLYNVDKMQWSLLYNITCPFCRRSCDLSEIEIEQNCVRAIYCDASTQTDNILLCDKKLSQDVIKEEAFKQCDHLVKKIKLLIDIC